MQDDIEQLEQLAAVIVTAGLVAGNFLLFTLARWERSETTHPESSIHQNGSITDLQIGPRSSLIKAIRPPRVRRRKAIDCAKTVRVQLASPYPLNHRLLAPKLSQNAFRLPHHFEVGLLQQP